MIIFSFILSLFANHLPVMYVQVPQWADDWAVCAVDIPDAKCHWYVCLLYTSDAADDP